VEKKKERKEKEEKRRWIARIIKLLAEKLRDDKKLGIPLGAPASSFPFVSLASASSSLLSPL